MTIKALETITVGSGGAASVTFASIPQDAKSLIIHTFSGVPTASIFPEQVNVTFNNDTTTSNYFTLRTRNDSDENVEGNSRILNATYGGFRTDIFRGVSRVFIPNYTSTDPKSYSSISGTQLDGFTQFQRVQGRYSGTSGISEIQLTPNSGNNFDQNSEFTLYQVVND